MVKVRSPLAGLRGPFGKRASGGGGGGGPAPDPHRFWMIKFTGSVGSSVVTISQLEMREGRFGPNVLADVTLTDNGHYGGNVSSQVISGDLATPSNNFGWVGSPGGPDWILKVDFGADTPRDIKTVCMQVPGGTFSTDWYPTAFEVYQSDDDADYTLSWSESALSWSAYEWQQFNNDEAPSYTGSPWDQHDEWQLFAIYTQGMPTESYWPVMTEIEFRATPGGADQCSGGTANGYPVYSGEVGSKAFDDNTGTAYTSNRMGGYAGYQFAAPVRCGEFTLVAAGNPPHTPALMHVRFRDGSGPWTTAWVPAVQSGWSSLEQRAFTDPAYI